MEHQLELPFPNPFDVSNLRGRWFGKKIDGCYQYQVISEPKFDWNKERWIALCQIEGALCLTELKITHEDLK